MRERGAMSDTPCTDAIMSRPYMDEHSECVFAELARQLERELAAARARSRRQRRELHRLHMKLATIWESVRFVLHAENLRREQRRIRREQKEERKP